MDGRQVVGEPLGQIQLGDGSGLGAQRLSQLVNGHWNRFAANTALSPKTTPAAMAARRSVRPDSPAYSRYATQDSIENHAAVWMTFTTST